MAMATILLSIWILMLQRIVIFLVQQSLPEWNVKRRCGGKEWCRWRNTGFAAYVRIDRMCWIARTELTELKWCD